MSKKRSKAVREENLRRAAERAAAARRQREIKDRRQRAVGVVSVVVGVFAVIFAVAFVAVMKAGTGQAHPSSPHPSNARPSKSAPTQPTPSAAGTNRAAAAPKGAVGYALPFGSADAPVTVTVYEDFMSPESGAFEAASQDLLHRYVDAGKVRLEYHEVPFLDSKSGAADYSTRAANAFAVVYGTAGQHAARKLHDLLYLNQPSEGTTGLTDQQLVGYAVRAGASRSAVTGPIDHLRFGPWVAGSGRAAAQAGATTTPTVLVDGTRVRGHGARALARALRRAIRSDLG